MGLYAGSHDSYYKFIDLFGRVIKEYHAFTFTQSNKPDHHVTDIDFNKIQMPILSLEE